MKRLCAGILAILALVSTSSANADFFLDRVVSSSPEKTRVERISLGNYSFKNATHAASYRDSLYFLSKAKNEALRRFEDGRISAYRLSDTANELEYLAHSLNHYFANLSAYERTGSKFYKNLAATNLADAKATYVRLKAVTIKR